MKPTRASPNLPPNGCSNNSTNASTNGSTNPLSAVSLPVLIGRTALEHYETQLPSKKGKPQPGREWTVYAAIVATATHNDGKRALEPGSESTNVSSPTSNVRAWVVSCAT